LVPIGCCGFHTKGLRRLCVRRDHYEAAALWLAVVAYSCVAVGIPGAEASCSVRVATADGRADCRASGADKAPTVENLRM